jgi:hypothetical protein
MESLRKISDPVPPGEGRFDTPFRQIWMEVRAYLVEKDQAEKVFAWMLKQNFWGRWMPESSSQTGVFMGEFYWSPAYKAIDNAYHGHPGWSPNGERGLPAALAQTTDRYLNERGYDCSVEESVSVCIPSKVLSDGMELTWRGRDGVFNDMNGSRAAYDPTVFSAGPHALLVRRNLLEKYLADHNLALVWTVLGGKQYLERDREEWKGEVQSNRAYRLAASGVEGKVIGTYRGPN